MKRKSPVVRLDKGRYVNLSYREDRCRVFLTKEGREYLRECRTKPGEYRSSEILLMGDLFSDFTACDYTSVRPEQVGDLRDDAWLVFTDDYTYYDDNDDDILIVGVAWSYHQYAVESYIDPLVKKGYIDFSKHEYYDPWSFRAMQAKSFLDGSRKENPFASLPPSFCEAMVEEYDASAEGQRRLREASCSEWFGQMRLPLEVAA